MCLSIIMRFQLTILKFVLRLFGMIENTLHIEYKWVKDAFWEWFTKDNSYDEN